MKLHNNKYVNIFGFTLIELLVVITIIWILATGSVTIYTSQIQKARDSTRTSDMKALQASVEQFYNDKYVYPYWADWRWSNASTVQSFSPNLAEDPKKWQTCINSVCDYMYVVDSDTNGITQGAYELSTAFENLWNIEWYWCNTKDSWNDNHRLEVGTKVSGINTGTPASYTSPASYGSISDKTERKGIVIRKNWVAVTTAELTATNSAPKTWNSVVVNCNN
jgi:prepilin-type N-terminal cleavage/methylation domain-containing protein